METVVIFLNNYINLRNNGNEDWPFITDRLKTRKVHNIHYSYDSNKNVDDQPYGAASSPLVTTGCLPPCSFIDLNSKTALAAVLHIHWHSVTPKHGANNDNSDDNDNANEEATQIYQ